MIALQTYRAVITQRDVSGVSQCCERYPNLINMRSKQATVM
jgi:hypothetical protein